MYVQIRVIVAITHMCGYNPKDDEVKTLVFSCLTRQAATDILKAGIKPGSIPVKNAIKKIPNVAIKTINQVW